MRQHRQQRHFNLVEHRQQLCALLQLRPHRQVQLQRDIGVFGSVRRRLLKRDLIERQLVLALAGDLFEGDGFVAQITIGQAVHIMTAADAVQHIGLQHGVVGDAAHLDAVTRQQAHIELQILPDLQRFRLPAAA